MHATDAKTQKIEPDPKFFWRTKISEAVCKRDRLNVRSYLIFNVRKFRTQCAETFKVNVLKISRISTIIKQNYYTSIFIK